MLKRFIKYLSGLFFCMKVNGHSLSFEQKKVVLNNDDVCQVVAGAGSGKTLTMIGKIRYLVDKKNIDPRKILVLSFTNYTTNSFKKSLCNDLVDVFTFHKLGINILKKAKFNFKICSDKLFINIINDYFLDLIHNRIHIKELVEMLIINSEECLCDKNVFMNDEEVVIGNFLYCNGIKYIYKPIEVIDGKVIFAFYLEDYDIYIKHEYFGELLGTELVENNYPENYIVTNSYLFTYDDIFEYLYNEFKCRGVNFDQNIYFEIADIFLLKGNKFEKLVNLIITFISMLKSNNYDLKKIDEIRKNVNKMSKKGDRKKFLFILSLIENIYIRYEVYLNQNSELDFNDIINVSTNLIDNGKVILNYNYIIIDEFQDTSYSRYDLIKAVKKQTGANLLVVGDDFQSIYRFTGCDTSLFLNFRKCFKNAKVMFLKNTYRNSLELIKVAGNFIMKNELQIKKKLKSNKRLDKPIKIYFYKEKSEINCLFKSIVENNIFILGRNNRDISFLDDLRTNKGYTFMSVHKSKGLECDGVVIVNLYDNLIGFPNKCTEDKLIKYLLVNEEEYLYAEERRLFYVALTRSKGNVYLFVPEVNPSVFVREIIKDYKMYIEYLN